MIDLKTKVYKEITMRFQVDENGLFASYVDGISNCNSYTTLAASEEALIKEINEFLDDVPKNYEELAKKIEKSLVWTSYEECYIDETALKIIIENYIKYTIKA